MYTQSREIAMLLTLFLFQCFRLSATKLVYSYWTYVCWSDSKWNQTGKEVLSGCLLFFISKNLHFESYIVNRWNLKSLLKVKNFLSAALLRLRTLTLSHDMWRHFCLIRFIVLRVIHFLNNKKIFIPKWKLLFMSL